MRTRLTWAASALVLVFLTFLSSDRANAELMIVGNDEKVGWDEAGKPAFKAPGKDTISM